MKTPLDLINIHNGVEAWLKLVFQRCLPTAKRATISQKLHVLSTYVLHHFVGKFKTNKSSRFICFYNAPDLQKSDQSKMTQNTRAIPYILYIQKYELLLRARCKCRKSRNTVGYRMITRELQTQSRRFKSCNIAGFKMK